MEERIAYDLAEESTGQTIAELFRRSGVSEQTFYRWGENFGGLDVRVVRPLRQLENESAKLKPTTADLYIDKAVLHGVLRKTSDHPASDGSRSGTREMRTG